MSKTKIELDLDTVMTLFGAGKLMFEAFTDDDDPSDLQRQILKDLEPALDHTAKALAEGIVDAGPAAMLLYMIGRLNPDLRDQIERDREKAEKPVPRPGVKPSPDAAKALKTEIANDGPSPDDSILGATDCPEGCVVEIDGHCPHGYMSASMTFGAIG